MPGTHHHAALLAAPDRQATERTAQLCAQLQSGRGPVRQLLRLTEFWYRPSSCLGVPRRASPTREQLELVAKVGRDSLARADGVHAAIAALSALRSAATASQVAPELREERWEAQRSWVAFVHEALGQPQVLIRLNAAAFCAAFPTVQLRASLEPCLDDPTYTIRWRAVRALVGLIEKERLVAVLARSAPRGLAAEYAHWRYAPYFDARSALTEVASVRAD